MHNAFKTLLLAILVGFAAANYINHQPPAHKERPHLQNEPGEGYIAWSNKCWSHKT